MQKKKTGSWIGIATGCTLICALFGFIYGHLPWLVQKLTKQQIDEIHNTQTSWPAVEAVGDFGQP